MKLNKQDEHQIMLFEEYIDALIDRRVAHIQFPGNPTNFEEAAVAAARTTFIAEVFNDK